MLVFHEEGFQLRFAISLFDIFNTAFIILHSAAAQITQTGSILICCFSFLHQVVLEQVCRIARIISSPHEVAHLVLVAEGCPGRCTLMANLAANLCGFTVAHINPSPMSSAMQYKMDVFKADLVAAYTRAGVKVRVDILWPFNTLRPMSVGFGVIIFPIYFTVRGLGPVWYLAIIWTSNDPVYWNIYPYITRFKWITVNYRYNMV